MKRVRCRGKHLYLCTPTARQEAERQTRPEAHGSAHLQYPQQQKKERPRVSKGEVRTKFLRYALTSSAHSGTYMAPYVHACMHTDRQTDIGKKEEKRGKSTLPYSRNEHSKSETQKVRYITQYSLHTWWVDLV